MKLELHEHISRLLFDHECVVVPGFGAFLTRYYPAEVNQATHMMRPPSRRVYFNKSIRENDGLLAKSISLYEHKPYDMALAAIRKETARWEEVLASGKKVRIPGVGRLYTDNASNVQFSPSLENNYLTSSYGLSIFRQPAIQRDTAIRKNIHKAIEKHIVPDTTKQKQGKQKEAKRKRIPWAAVLGPVIFAGIVGAAYYTYQQNGFENLSGLNLISFSNSTEEAAPAEEEKTAIVAEETTSVEEEEITSRAASDHFAVAPAEETTSESAEMAEEPAPVASAGYHIVIGSFKDQENADSYLLDLESKGIDAYYASGSASFHRVAVGNFSSRAQALKALNNIRRDITPKAWIYSN